MASLGLDVGASKVYYIALEEAERLDEGSLEIPQSSPQELLNIFKKIKETLQEKNITADQVGLGAPGLVEEETLSFAPNFPDLVGFPIVKETKEIFGVPVILINDANAFTYGEVAMGAATGLKNVVGLTLGSGLGGGLVIEGKLYVGQGAEVGHTVLNLKDDQEAEELISSKFFTKEGKDPIEAQKQAEGGDEEAQKMYEEFGKNLGHLIANIVNTLDPEAVVVGGGISEAYDLFIEPAKEAAKKHIVNPKSKEVPILKAALGRAAGAAGAALLAQLSQE